MLGFTRRRKTEGWAVNISDADGDTERPSLFRRLAESNKVWMVCLAIIVIATFILVKNSSRNAGQLETVVPPRQAPADFGDRAAYAGFEREFKSDNKFAGFVLEARFATPGLFEIVVPGGTSADNIEYAARMAGVRIRHDLGHRAVIQVYRKSAKGGERILVATAQWQPKRDGYFVKFQPLP